MRLRITSWLFLLALLAAACSGTKQPSGESTSTGAGEQVPTADTFIPTMLSPGDLQLTANCTVVSTRPTPGPTQESLFPPVSEDDWVKGMEEAEVTILEYSDFQ